MKKSSAWCMLVPGLVILFLFLMIPLLRVLVPSVFTGDYPFSAYVDFFKDEYYRKIFLRTVKIAVITTFVCMVGGIPTAYFISRCDKKWRGLLLSASIFPMMTNSVIRSFAWINILGSNGIINKAMIAMGLIEKPMKLLYTDFSIIIGSVYLFLPLMIVTVAGVMENIDDDMMEAAHGNMYQKVIDVFGDDKSDGFLLKDKIYVCKRDKSTGAPFGILIGVALGIVYGMLFDNLALGISIGFCFGISFSMIWGTSTHRYVQHGLADRAEAEDADNVIKGLGSDGEDGINR